MEMPAEASSPSSILAELTCRSRRPTHRLDSAAVAPADQPEAIVYPAEWHVNACRMSSHLLLHPC